MCVFQVLNLPIPLCVPVFMKFLLLCNSFNVIFFRTLEFYNFTVRFSIALSLVVFFLSFVFSNFLVLYVIFLTSLSVCGFFSGWSFTISLCVDFFPSFDYFNLAVCMWVLPILSNISLCTWDFQAMGFSISCVCLIDFEFSKVTICRRNQLAKLYKLMHIFYLHHRLAPN